MARTRDAQLAPAWSDDVELVLAYARRGRHRYAPADERLGTRMRWRPCEAVSWPGGIVVSGTKTRIPRAE